MMQPDDFTGADPYRAFFLSMRDLVEHNRLFGRADADFAALLAAADRDFETALGHWLAESDFERLEGAA